MLHHHETPSGPSRPPVDHDKVDAYRNSVAWRDMKKLYGRQFYLDRLFAGMERLYACAEVRLFLANALHHWLNMTPAQRRAAFHAFAEYRAEQSAIYMAEHGHFDHLEHFEQWRDQYRRRLAADQRGQDRAHELGLEDDDDD